MCSQASSLDLAGRRVVSLPPKPKEVANKNSKREKGNYDGIEHFNFYSPEFEDDNRVPRCVVPFMDEISSFCDVSIMLC